MEEAVSQLPSDGPTDLYGTHQGGRHERGKQKISWFSEDQGRADGLAEQRGLFITVTRPVLSALMLLKSYVNQQISICSNTDSMRKLRASKLISKPKEGNKPMVRPQSFRDSTYRLI